MGSVLSAQVTYTLNKTTALTTAAEILTVQQPAANTNVVPKYVTFVSVYLDSTVACTFTLERNGTAATTTALTPSQVNPQLATPAIANGFSASNVGVGTVIARGSLAANGSITIDISDIKMTGADNTQNFTLRTSSITGTVDIIIKWREL